MLENLKIYLGISESDTSKDSLLNLLLSMVGDDIKGYCNVDELPIGIENVQIKLAASYFQKRKSDGYSQVTQGSRSVSIMNSIPEEIKNMLSPYRRIKLRG